MLSADVTNRVLRAWDQLLPTPDVVELWRYRTAQRIDTATTPLVVPLRIDNPRIEAGEVVSMSRNFSHALQRPVTVVLRRRYGSDIDELMIAESTK